MSKKQIAILLIISLLMVNMSTDVTAKTSTVKLNKKSATINVGEKLTLKVKNAKKKVVWKSSKKKVAVIKSMSGKHKQNAVVVGKRAGKTVITAKVGKKSLKCEIKVVEKNNDATSSSSAESSILPVMSNVPDSTLEPDKSGENKGNIETGSDGVEELVYNLKDETGHNTETGESFAPPVVCNYNTFIYSSFAIWLCRFEFYDPANTDTKDCRGKKLKFEITFTNSGENDLAELAFGFMYGYKREGKDISYPCACHMIDKNLRNTIANEKNQDYSFDEVKNRKNHDKCTFLEQSIEKGKTYTVRFTHSIPKDAMNGDIDSHTGLHYPIMFYIANLKVDGFPYREGDEVTIQDFKIYVIGDAEE